MYAYIYKYMYSKYFTKVFAFEIQSICILQFENILISNIFKFDPMSGIHIVVKMYSTVVSFYSTIV